MKPNIFACFSRFFGGPTKVTPPPKESAPPRIAPTTSTPEPFVAPEIAPSIAASLSPAAAELLKLLSNPDKHVRIEAVTAALEAPNSDNVAVLAAATNDPEYRVSETAVEALAAIRTEDALDELTRLVNRPWKNTASDWSPSDSAKSTAISQLASLDDPITLDILITHLQSQRYDSRDSSRLHCLRELRRNHRTSHPKIVAALSTLTNAELDVQLLAGEILLEQGYENEAQYIFASAKQKSDITGLKEEFEKNAHIPSDQVEILKTITLLDPDALWPWLEPSLKKPNLVSEVVRALVWSGRQDSHYAILEAAETMDIKKVEDAISGVLSGAEFFGFNLPCRSIFTESNNILLKSVVSLREKWTPDTSKLTIDELVQILLGASNSWKGGSLSEELAVRVRAVGLELSRRGGLEEMRRVHSVVKTHGYGRTIEYLWNGIGGWYN